MKTVLPIAAFALMALGAASTAEAKSWHHDRYHHDDRYDHHDRYDRHEHHDRHWGDRHRSRTIYVIENHRPVSRVVYVDDAGGYYRFIDGRRVYVRGRYFTSYPSRYYYPNGRPRVGVSIRF